MYCDWDCSESHAKPDQRNSEHLIFLSDSSSILLLFVFNLVTMQVAQILSDLTSLQVCVRIPSKPTKRLRTNQPRIITTPSPSSPSTRGFPAPTPQRGAHPRRNLHPSTPRSRRSTMTSVAPRSWWSYTTKSRRAMRTGSWTMTLRGQGTRWIAY